MFTPNHPRPAAHGLPPTTYRLLPAAFTLIEILVVLLIIGMLAAILVPAVLGAREKARVAQCADHQKNLAQAAIRFDLEQGHFPGYADRVPGGYTAEAGWPVMLLKLIDREDVWNAFRGGSGSSARIAVFVCPSDSDAAGSGPTLSYAANCGQPDAGEVTATVGSETEYLGKPADNIPPDWAANGIFFRRYTQSGDPMVKEAVTADDIKDGERHTFLLSERRGDRDWSDSPAMEDGFGFLWRPIRGDSSVELWEDTQCNVPAGINGEPPAGVATSDLPSSYHAGGVNVAYCDGHVVFLAEDVSYKVYALQMTPNGAETWGAGYAKGKCGAPADPGEPPAWCREPLPKP